MRPRCVDLRDFGYKYRVVSSSPSGVVSPALLSIPGKRGYVFAWGRGKLAAATRAGGVTRERLLTLPRVRVWTDTGDGLIVLFKPDQFEEVAAILGLHHKRGPKPGGNRGRTGKAVGVR